jgi:hypothetical protein
VCLRPIDSSELEASVHLNRAADGLVQGATGPRQFRAGLLAMGDMEYPRLPGRKMIAPDGRSATSKYRM